MSENIKNSPQPLSHLCQPMRGSYPSNACRAARQQSTRAPSGEAPYVSPVPWQRSPSTSQPAASNIASASGLSRNSMPVSERIWSALASIVSRPSSERTGKQPIFRSIYGARGATDDCDVPRLCLDLLIVPNNPPKQCRQIRRIEPDPAFNPGPESPYRGPTFRSL